MPPPSAARGADPTGHAYRFAKLVMIAAHYVTATAGAFSFEYILAGRPNRPPPGGGLASCCAVSEPCEADRLQPNRRGKGFSSAQPAACGGLQICAGSCACGREG